MDKVDAAVARNADKLSDVEKVALVLCANSFRLGGNWGFLRDTIKDYRSTLSLLQQGRPNVQAVQLNNGTLVFCSEDFLATAVNTIAPNALGEPFVRMFNARKASEREKFFNFLNRVFAGKSRYIKKRNGFYEITVGLFCVNDINVMRLNGVDYPAYKVTLVEALEFMKYITKGDKKVFARTVGRQDKVEAWKSITSGDELRHLSEFYSGLEIAESETGVFFTLRIKV